MSAVDIQELPPVDRVLVRQYASIFCSGHPDFNLGKQGQIYRQRPELLPYLKAQAVVEGQKLQERKAQWAKDLAEAEERVNQIKARIAKG